MNALATLTERVSKEKPKPEDVRAFRALLRDHPGLWRFAGDLSGMARAALTRYTSTNAGSQQAIEQGMQEEQNALGYGSA